MDWTSRTTYVCSGQYYYNNRICRAHRRSTFNALIALVCHDVPRLPIIIIPI